jgi:hypothetical protein
VNGRGGGRAGPGGWRWQEAGSVVVASCSLYGSPVARRLAGGCI